MDFPNIDTSNPKQLLVVGGIAGVAVIALLHKTTAQQPAQTVTVQPPSGASWSDVIPPNNSGVIGSIGPGEPVPGSSAYDIWLAQGHTGTQQDFLNSLKGPAGPQGKPGTPAPPPKPVPATSPWVKVSYNGKTGYAHSAYLCGNKVCNTGGDGLRLRATASFTGMVITVMPEGASVSRLAGGEAVYHNPNPGGSVGGFYPIPHPFKGGKLTVQAGDTYASLASKTYGSVQWWNRLAALNGNQPLRVGMSLDR